MTITKDQCGEFIHFIIKSMKNHVSATKGNKTSCRYSPQLMGLSMGLFLQSPKVYELLRQDLVIVFPSAKTFSAIKHNQKIKDGKCIEMFEDQVLIRGSTDEWGQLKCDEMKLKQDVVLMNTKMEKTMGFTMDFGWCNLPGQLDQNHPGCFMLFMIMWDIHSSWLDSRLRDVRRQKNPKLFLLNAKKSANHGGGE